MTIRSALLLTLLLACADLANGHPHLRRPRRGEQIRVGPVTVPPGEELTQCTYLKLPHQRDLAVNQVAIRVWGGSHHIHLYRSQDPTRDLPDGYETCNFALDFADWQLVLASQGPRLKWRLPRGVAFFFRGGEQLAAQTHFVDSGLLRTRRQGWAIMNLHAIPPREVTAYAGAFFGQDRDVVVPPGTSTTATTRCVFPHPVKLLALTGHYHYRGTHFTAASWDGEGGQELYRYDGYLEPAFLRFGEADAPEVQGIQWTCTYDNPGDETYMFGPFTDRNEHCNLFMFYYPTASPEEFMTCVQENGVAEVKVTGH